MCLPASIAISKGLCPAVGSKGIPFLGAALKKHLGDLSGAIRMAIAAARQEASIRGITYLLVDDMPILINGG